MGQMAHPVAVQRPPNSAETLRELMGRIQWFNFTMLIIVPVCGFILTFWTPLTLKTCLLCAVYYVLTAGSVTAGAMQGSIRFWVREHRAHHRYTDTDRDPYNIKAGFWHAHILWVLVKQPKRDNRVDVSDIRGDAIVQWQHSNYVALAFLMGWGFPTLVAGLGWHDWRGGFVYGGIIRTFLVTQATFCVNSLAHHLGDQPFDDRRTPRDHILTALITLGEGYHNFHHEFPSDYRNGIEWWQLDVTKWMIAFCSYFGLAYDLKRFRHSEIEKGRIQQSRKRLDERSSWLDWGLPIADLPVIEWDAYQTQVTHGSRLILVEGIVHDVAKFYAEHPGGEAIISSYFGKDATAVFNGGVYNHSNAARNFLATMRTAVIAGGAEVEARKIDLPQVGSESVE